MFLTAASKTGLILENLISVLLRSELGIDGRADSKPAPRKRLWNSGWGFRMFLGKVVIKRQRASVDYISVLGAYISELVHVSL